ncbi:U-scoloptoxin(01)-Cw1a-like [Eriocheir sinensis]|uniref:U-scoloptoxin(01)-Cw1a-like n=1 Tax=Eriocheir sinensis TaxID=95602 RepID=UPI0021C79593|nr:U-scoloptoxin(01)-Cw1a-like [Eriocheir sinensis]
MAHTQNRLALAVFLAVGACLMGVARSRMAYVFPADYDLITGQVVQQFACEGRPYGYYADVDNACRVFHICLPIQDNEGQVVQTAHFSFICGNQTVFDQETLTCNHPEYAFPCDQAPSLYDSRNALFGQVDQEF